MSLGKDFAQFVAESREFQGKVLENLDNLEEHLKAVSHKAGEIREELSDHKDNAGAHGIESSSKTGSAIAGWLGLVASIVAVGLALVKL